MRSSLRAPAATLVEATNSSRAIDVAIAVIPLSPFACHPSVLRVQRGSARTIPRSARIPDHCRAALYGFIIGVSSIGIELNAPELSTLGNGQNESKLLGYPTVRRGLIDRPKNLPDRLRHRHTGRG